MKDLLVLMAEYNRAADELIVNFISDAPDNLFDKTIEVSRPGKQQTRKFPFGKILMHLFNHQSHHRGAVSQILDQNDVENDYSNVMQLLVG